MISISSNVKRIHRANDQQIPSSYLLNNMAANNTIGTTQFRSIRNPKTRFPIKAPPRPNVSDSAAAMTLYEKKTSISIWKEMFSLCRFIHKFTLGS